MRSWLEPEGALSVIPGTRFAGGSDLFPLEYGYLHLRTASTASSGVSTCGKIIPAAPVTKEVLCKESKPDINKFRIAYLHREHMSVNLNERTVREPPQQSFHYWRD
jgi:hypothetical protein